MDTIDGNALRGHLEALILAALESAPAHGFEIMKRLDAGGRGALALKEGTVYPILYRLERNGHLRAAWDPDTSTSGGPRRRVYQITAKGRKELARQRARWDLFVTTLGPLIGAPS